MDKEKINSSRQIQFLVIEDEKTAIKMYEDFLRELGYGMDTAVTGQEAVKKVDQGHYDVVILDLKLPDIHGMEVLNLIKDKINKAPVIIVTANPTLESAIEAVRGGIVYDYIVKPFSEDDFRLVIQRAAEKVYLQEENMQLSDKLDIVNKALKERIEELEGFAGKAAEYEATINQLVDNVALLEVTLKSIKKSHDK